MTNRTPRFVLRAADGQMVTNDTSMGASLTKSMGLAYVWPTESEAESQRAGYQAKLGVDLNAEPQHPVDKQKIPTSGSVGKHDWVLGEPSGDGFSVFVDDRQLGYRKSIEAGRNYALILIERLFADGDYRLNDKPAGFLPPQIEHEIGYAYPSSDDARKFGHAKEGCYILTAGRLSGAYLLLDDALEVAKSYGTKPSRWSFDNPVNDHLFEQRAQSPRG